MDCPICKTTIGDIKENLFCPVCHWELAALPTNALSLMKDYKDRFRVFHSSHDNSDTIESLSHKIKTVQEKNESIKMELAKVKTEIGEKTNEFGQLEIERTALQKAQKENLKKQTELKEIEKKIEKEKNCLKALSALADNVDKLEEAYKCAFHRGFGYKLGVIKMFLDDYNNAVQER